MERTEPRCGELRLTALAAITLGLCVLGLAGSVLLAARQGAAASVLGVLFGFGALRQAFLLFDGSVPSWEVGAAALAELALLGVALGGLTALRALRRTTRERDSAEDLHWDSMEAVRVMSELAAHPGADLSDKLKTVLDLGAARFRLEIGVAWRESGKGAGEVIGLRTPASGADRCEALVAELLPRLREASRAARPQVFFEREGELRVFFGASVRVDSAEHGALAFAGSRDPVNRFTATDKDLLGLMAQWLTAELERKSRAAEQERALPAEPASLPAQPAAVASIRGAVDRPPSMTFPTLASRLGRDLNTAVRRAERQLRRRVGAGGTLEISLDPGLPLAGGGRLSLSTLVESVVQAAASLEPTGCIQIETRRLEDADAGAGQAAHAGYITLRVSVTGEAVDAEALERIFDEPKDPELVDALPLVRVERLLQRDGGDLSVSVEPGRGAVLTAYLRPRAPRAAQAVGAQETAQLS